MDIKKLKYPCYLLFIAVTAVITHGCTESIYEQEKYQSPEWLKGKIFSQIQEEQDLGTYISLLKKTGYDSILNTSGSYTVFAPTDEAFEIFFQDHPEYRSWLESEEPSQKLNALVEYQVLFSAWSKKQFTILDVGGWIDPEDEFAEPRGFKRQTLFHEENKSYPAKRIGTKYRIVEPSQATASKKAYTKSNKYGPVFFQDYLDIYDLSGSDYEYYFNRAFDPGKLYYAGAEFEEEIPAENGFIYKTDKVVIPLPNGEEILEKGHKGHTYNTLLGMIHRFSEFTTNLEATFNQPGAELGLEVDTLYNLAYPDLVFNIHNELTGITSNPRYTVRDHHGLMAPTDQALASFINEYLPVWGELKGIPEVIINVIVNSHMSEDAVYPSDFSRGIINGEGDRVFLDEADIIQVTYGSNCSFFGLNRAIVPRVFKSVCRPMYLTRDFEIMMYAVESSRALSALKKQDANYAFYLPSDQGIGPGGDSSLLRVIDNPELNTYHFETLDRDAGSLSKRDLNELRKSILNQIAVSTPDATANKEFLRNLGGNYIIVDHTEGKVRGSALTTFGYNGSQIIDLYPELYQEETDNGNVYKVSTWFNFQRRGYYVLFISGYIEFLNLLGKAGLYDASYNDFPFLIDGESYTVFVPSAQALTEYGADTLPRDELREFLKYHFLIGDLIFTDGKKADGQYTTTRIDESSTTYITEYSKLSIRTKPDVIQILDKNGDVYIEIREQEGKNNIMVTHDTNEESESPWDHITTGVVHEIDKVLIIDTLRIE
jgi:uncharacterized surface protein with fasciclin (FAS1) repeats